MGTLYVGQEGDIILDLLLTLTQLYWPTFSLLWFFFFFLGGGPQFMQIIYISIVFLNNFIHELLV